jgi:uncharacterized membrane protein HdeD (DUF308 family)
MTIIDILQTVAIGGALACGGAYVYGYVVKPKGNRRMHVASLLFSGIALANVPGLLNSSVSAASTIYAVNLVFFLLLSAVLQAITAFRGRSADRQHNRRASDRVADDRRAEPKPELKDAA